MRAHNNDDAESLARLLTGEQKVLCKIHGEIPINIIGPYFWPSFPACPTCVFEFLREKFPVEIIDKEK